MLTLDQARYVLDVEKLKHKFLLDCQYTQKTLRIYDISLVVNQHQLLLDDSKFIEYVRNDNPLNPFTEIEIKMSWSYTDFSFLVIAALLEMRFKYPEMRNTKFVCLIPSFRAKDEIVHRLHCFSNSMMAFIINNELYRDEREKFDLLYQNISSASSSKNELVELFDGSQIFVTSDIETLRGRKGDVLFVLRNYELDRDNIYDMLDLCYLNFKHVINFKE
jgi:hypothetical protein